MFYEQPLFVFTTLFQYHKNMNINKYVTKINYYINEFSDSNLIYFRKISTRLESLKQLLYSPIYRYINDLENRLNQIFDLLNSIVQLYKDDRFDSLDKISEDIISLLDNIILERNNIAHDNRAVYNTDSYYENVIEALNEKLNDSQQKIKNLVELNKKLSRADEDKIIIQKQIEELQKKLELGDGVKRELENQNSVLLNQLNRLNGIIGHYNEEKEKLIVLQKENERINEIVKKYEIELEKSKQRDDAINNWKNKISDAFKGLEGPINRLNEEHTRLVWLYNIYKNSSIGLVIFLIIIEIIVYFKIIYSDTYPTWDQYLPMALPVPITLGLLWGFITQMNRAQRQMVVLSNKIHEIKYTEGLLQALNTLSVDIGESMSKINDAISRLIDNHLRNMDNMRLDENDLSKIEKQNALPIEQIPELIKLINKSKE